MHIVSKQPTAGTAALNLPYREGDMSKKSIQSLHCKMILMNSTDKVSLSRLILGLHICFEAPMIDT